MVVPNFSEMVMALKFLQEQFPPLQPQTQPGPEHEQEHPVPVQLQSSGAAFLLLAEEFWLFEFDFWLVAVALWPRLVAAAEAATG
jgi:hypothetical protein